MRVSRYWTRRRACTPPSGNSSTLSVTLPPISSPCRNGAHQYKLTFPKGATPPVKGFWSITMYEISKGWWFVPNPLNRFTASMRNNPSFNPDGSLTLPFQNSSPGKDKENNWLPAPKGDFILMLRMYWPNPDSPSILEGSWKPPAVERVA